LIGFCVIRNQKSACAAFLANDVLYFIPKHWLQFVYPKASHGLYKWMQIQIISAVAIMVKIVVQIRATIE